MKATMDEILFLVNTIHNDKDLGKQIRNHFKRQELVVDNIKFYPLMKLWYDDKKKKSGLMRGNMS